MAYGAYRSNQTTASSYIGIRENDERKAPYGVAATDRIAARTSNDLSSRGLSFPRRYLVRQSQKHDRRGPNKA